MNSQRLKHQTQTIARSALGTRCIHYGFQCSVLCGTSEYVKEWVSDFCVTALSILVVVVVFYFPCPTSMWWYCFYLIYGCILFLYFKSLSFSNERLKGSGFGRGGI